MTLIGLRVAVEALKVARPIVVHEYLPCEKCKKTQVMKYCGDCGTPNQMVNRHTTFIDFHPEVRTREMDSLVLSVGTYPAYYEAVGNEDLNYVYLYIYKAVKRGPRSYNCADVQFLPGENLFGDRAAMVRSNMKKWFVDNSVLTTEAFDKAFGVYTLVEAS